MSDWLHNRDDARKAMDEVIADKVASGEWGPKEVARALEVKDAALDILGALNDGMARLIAQAMAEPPKRKRKKAQP